MHLTLTDFTVAFEEAPEPKLIINDMPASTAEEIEQLEHYIMTTYEGSDILSSTPSCHCGKETMGTNLGKLCSSCETLVVRPSESSISSGVWMRVPPGVKGFLNPNVWMMLDKPTVLRTSNAAFSVMEWIVKPGIREPDNLKAATLNRINHLKSIGWVRGINYLIDNFDRFIDELSNMGIRDCELYQRFLRNNRAHMFSEYLPMPTKALVVLENTALGSFADLSITGAVDAARTVISYANNKSRENDVRYMETKAAAVMYGLTSYYMETISNAVTRGKRAWLRGQVFSSKSHFCARGVITSISAPHVYDEVFIPWAQGLELFKIHLVRKLEQRGWDFRTAFATVENSGNVYVPILEELLAEILAEFKDGGAPTILQRNPSLTRASAQCLRITRVKSDPEDQTIALSVLVLAGFNADFDGDEMNLTLVVSENLYESVQLLKPHYAIHSISDLGEVNKNMSLPDVAVSNIANWLGTE